MSTIGIDLGSNHVRYIHNNEVLFDEPGFIAYDTQYNTSIIGWEAHDQIGKNRVYPLLNKKHILAFLDELFYQMSTFKVFRRTDIFICFPSTFSDSLCDDICQEIVKRGAREVLYDQAIWCATLGANLPNPSCILYMDQKESTIALYENQTLSKQESHSFTGTQIQESIKQWLQDVHHIQLSQNNLNELLESIGQVQIQPTPLRIQIHGIDTKTQKRKTVLLDENQVAQVLSALALEWAKWIYSFLMNLSPSIQQTIAQYGIYCCGITLELKGLASFLQSQLQIPFQLLQPLDQLTTIGIQQILTQINQGEWNE